MSPAEVGFESHPPHHHVENGGGFVRVMLRVFGLPEDLATIIWFAISTGITAGLSYYKESE
jgi:hypothetical protein